MALPRLVTGAGMALSLALLMIGPFVEYTAALDAPKPGVTVSPSFKELIVRPELPEVKTSVTVTNNSGYDLHAQLKLVDFDALNEFGGVSFIESDKPLSPYSLLQWINLPTGRTVRLPAGEDVTIPVTVSNDDRLAPGGHYGALIVSVSGGEAGRSTSQVTFNQEVASLFFVKKTGGETYGLKLESLVPNDIPGIPKRVDMKFKGTGNVHVAPRGYIEVKDPRGVLVAKGIINPESTLVLPNKSRHFTTVMQTVSDSKAKGNYTLTAYYRHEGSQEFQKETVTFRRGYNLLSTSIILPAAVVLTGVGFLLYRTKGRQARNRRK